MHKLIILINNSENSAAFDQRWLEFLYLTESLPDLLHETTVRVNTTLYGNADISMIHELHFDSKEMLERAMTSPKGQEAGQILQAVTQGRMSLLVAEHLEDNIVNLSEYRSRTHKDLDIFIKENKISGTILFLEVPTPTIEIAADAIGVKPDQILKSHLFSVDEEHVLVITSGTDPIELLVIAKHFDAERKKVKLTSPDVVLRVTGYSVDTVPPFGHREQLKTLLDRRAMLVPYVYAGGGAKNAFVKLNPFEIQRNTKADIVDLHTKPDDHE